ncbi:MAG TPA: type II toxin-antitoxin system VapC family toxin [Terriglobia bacterium]|nr:type II toxin-antitoxin system VapC family toxin [Terriglobia bacterium]
MKLVVDASVVAKCLVPETDTKRARKVLVLWAEARLDLMAPSILPSEIANMLWKRTRRNLLPVAEVGPLYTEFLGLRIPLVPADSLVEPALKLALHYGHSVYDGLYLALALQTGSDFLTADERLYNSVASALPQVRRLGDWD